VATALRGDGIPGNVSHSIAARCSKDWPLVPADHPGPGEDLCYGWVLNPPWAWDSLDLVLRCSGDPQVYYQGLKSADGDRSLNSIGLNLLCITVQLLTH
jgi:hypothetical protein